MNLLKNMTYETEIKCIVEYKSTLNTTQKKKKLPELL